MTTPNGERISAPAAENPGRRRATRWSSCRPSALGALVTAPELASQATDWTTPQRALNAIRAGMHLLSCSPSSCRTAELGNGRSRELIVPFGGAGYVVLFEIVGDDVVVGAVRHQREEDYRP